MRISDLSSDVCSSDLFYPLCQPTHGNHDSPHPPAQWKNRPQRWLRQGLNAPRVEALFPSPPIFRWAGYFLARTCSTSLDLEVPQRSKFIRCLWRTESFNRARSCVLNESKYDAQSPELGRES